MVTINNARKILQRVDTLPLYLHAYAFHLNMRLERVLPADLLDIATGCERGFARQSLPAKTRRAVCRCQSAGHQKSGDGRGDSLRSTSAFVAVYSRILAVVLPSGKTDLSPLFYPQPVAERGGTPGNS